MDQEECHKESVEVFTSIQLDSLLLESSKAGHIKVMEILIQYRNGINKFVFGGKS